MSEVTRRSALVAGGAVVAGGVAGFVIARNSDAADEENQGLANAYGPPAEPTSTARSAPSGAPASPPLLAVADVPAGGGIILKKRGVVITRDDGGTVHAFTVECPHQGCIVFRVQAGTIDCPCHGSKFDVATGKVVAGPSPSGLTPVPVTVTAGKVYPA